MRYVELTFGCAILLGGHLYANDGHASGKEVTFVNDRQALPDAVWQYELRHRPNWQLFLGEHGNWYVEFNESAHRPHRAYGSPIVVPGASAVERAWNFLGQELDGFSLPVQDLHVLGEWSGGKHTYVHFGQTHEGLKVLFADAMVKLDQSGRVVSFSTDLYTGIDVLLEPTISEATAMASASAGLDGLVSSTVLPGPALLPVPVFRGADHHLVLEVVVHTMVDQTPGRYRCLVDAHDGELLYRQNEVVEHVPPVGAEATIVGNVFEFNPYIPAAQMPLGHVEVEVNGSTQHADENGYINTGAVGPVSATFRLQGPWSTVRTAGDTPEFTTTLLEGSNAVNFDPHANIRERSAYFHVNIVHDHMKSWLPTFTGMDISLPTNVDVGGNCNAFYDGSSINFYAEGNDCQSYATIGEVVYHEYGHGINDKFYQSLGSSFSNGAMNEGYADIWGLSITEDPILAEGSSLSDPDDYIRRYDQDPKVYPSDLVGQVHADGEIIAGAWWDTYVLLGNDMNAMMELFIDAFPGLQANTFNGNEGQAFRDVLVDALQADDDDGDLSNGTPNASIIVEAFGIHGITLLSNAELIHEGIESSVQGEDIDVLATVILDLNFLPFVEEVRLFYKINNGSSWSTVAMTDVGGGDFQGTIPQQPEGTVIAYYLGILDAFQQVSAVQPIGAALPDPNVPYYILVGYSLRATEDLDSNNELGDWTPGLPTDNATTGQWELTIPIGSFATPGDPSTIVQTDAQHTPGGELCFVTGNASSPAAALGENDVDAGTTTLLSDPIDISEYENPTFTYYRWYINDPPSGANPGADWWQVYISADGSTWVPVEETRTSDRSWRRVAFRVQDHLPLGGTVQLRFNVSDSIRMGQNLDGGSLVEGALDDIQLWDNVGTIGIEEVVPSLIGSVFPSPANDRLTLSFDLQGEREGEVEVFDQLGKRMLVAGLRGNGPTQRVLDVSSWATGPYVLRLTTDKYMSEQRFQIVR
ncbi:MAG: T9SS type A sorting domain-containing protein [Flavobacteriales bacterium]|nr:T9SS type A sorting domain-containing protein [Flavobacteriales bacterium]